LIDGNFWIFHIIVSLLGKSMNASEGAGQHTIIRSRCGFVGVPRQSFPIHLDLPRWCSCDLARAFRFPLRPLIHNQALACLRSLLGNTGVKKDHVKRLAPIAILMLGLAIIFGVVSRVNAAPAIEAKSQFQ
jgi:hypothetical protein